MAGAFRKNRSAQVGKAHEISIPMAMKLHYYSKSANFGDAINTWLWDRLLPGCLDENADVRFSGIGTILRGDMPNAEHWVVFTSGVGYPPLPPDFGGKRWSVISVRGPLSAAALGLPAEAAVTDGAILLASLSEYAPLPEKERSGIVFVPHYAAELSGEWRGAAKRAGIEYLSPLSESREVIARLRSAKLVLADAMHAAIVADAMRVPWIPLVTSPQVNTFKWLDWTRSMKVQYAPVTLSSTTLVSRVHNAMLFVHGEHHALIQRSCACSCPLSSRQHGAAADMVADSKACRPALDTGNGAANSATLSCALASQGR